MTTATLEMSWLTISDTEEAHDASRAPAADDLWPVDEEAERIWEARRGRRAAVRNVGYACITALCALGASIAGAPTARGQMMAWGTMGRVTVPHAAIAAPAPAVDRGAVAAAPKAEAPAAPVAVAAPAAIEAPAAGPAPAAPRVAVVVAPVTIKVAAPSTARRGGRYLDDPYADGRVAAAASRPARAHDYLADPY